MPKHLVLIRSPHEQIRSVDGRIRHGEQRVPHLRQFPATNPALVMLSEAETFLIVGSAREASGVIDTRVIYCRDNLDQLPKLPDACVYLIYIDPPFNSTPTTANTNGPLVISPLAVADRGRSL